MKNIFRKLKTYKKYEQIGTFYHFNLPSVSEKLNRKLCGIWDYVHTYSCRSMISALILNHGINMKSWD